MLSTEADCPSNHPELNFKMPNLDIAVWVEEVEISAPWMKSSETNINEHCKQEEPCLPIGTSIKPVQEDMLGGGQEPSRRMVPPVYL